MKNSLKIILFLSALLFGATSYADSTSTVTQTDSNDITTTTTSPTTSAADAGIITNVQDSIAKQPLLNGFNITTSSLNGIVTLDGTVETQSQADAAVSAAKSVSGVKEVKSNIIVKTPVPTTT